MSDKVRKVADIIWSVVGLGCFIWAFVKSLDGNWLAALVGITWGWTLVAPQVVGRVLEKKER